MNEMNRTGWRGYAKAIVAFLSTLLTSLGTALIDDVITSAEWAGIALAVVVTTGAVFGVPNRTGSRVQAMGESMSHDVELDDNPMNDRSDPPPQMY